MQITRLALAPDQMNTEKIRNLYFQLDSLLEKISSRKLPEPIIIEINEKVNNINNSGLTGTHLQKLLKEKQTEILKYLEKELKIVPKNYYRNIWLAVGMATFGLPLGLVFGLSLNNIGLMGLGLPIGIAIGVAVGASMDKKALDEGRQIDIEIKY